MNTIHKAGLIGCGDYLQWEIDKLNNSTKMKVKYTFDLDPVKSNFRAKQLRADVAENVDVIFDDPEISIVLLYLPPFSRKEYFKRAALTGKHIITTKPLSNNLNNALELADIVKDKVECSVFYGRTGDAVTEELKRLFNSGKIGKLALYKEDWFHHYPTWNSWATDKEKNGGPFMDAMIHNLNKSRYLIGEQVEDIYFSSQNHAQAINCNDTEFMHVTFSNNKASHLFITWAADLEVFDTKANNREHIGPQYMISDKGWWIEAGYDADKPFIQAKKEGKTRIFEVPAPTETPYDQFCACLDEGVEQPFDIKDALMDIELWHKAFNQL